MTRPQLLRWLVFIVCLVFALTHEWIAPVLLHALPSGGQAAGGTAAIQSNGTTMTIQQQSNNALLNWQGFSIGAKETVQFLQPSATSLAVNRVLGGDPSVILGNLLANGRVFLLNPNGVVFGPGSVVNVGGLLATTLSLKSYDLEKGQFTFAQDPTKAFAAVVNQGTLRATDHGFVVLTASGVVNEGLIVAKFGHVGLGAGTQLAVDFRGDGLIRYAVDGKVMGQVTDPSGRPLSAAVTNAGRIEADGGTVLLTAHASSAVVSSVINQTGVIQARRLENQGGEIVLKGGDEGVVSVAGRLDATGEKGEKGGTITVRGEKIGLTETARLDVSGEAGGGTITVGGGFQGKDGGPNAQQTIVRPGAVLRADAITQGDGGTVIVWADGNTQFGGDISARGGAYGGNGGFAEVSGKESLVYRGTVELRAPLGQTGTLLLDPKFITIQSGGDDYAPPYTFVTNSGDSVTLLDAGPNSLSQALSTASVALEANTDITLAGAFVSTSSANGLTLHAGRSIILETGSTVVLQGGAFHARINDENAIPANRDAGTAQFVMNAGSTIATNGGNVTVSVGTFGGSQVGEVRIGNGSGTATISSGAGAIDITGIGHANAGEDFIDGIAIDSGSSIQSTTGAITLTGTGGAGRDFNVGIDIFNGNAVAIQSSGGPITLTGTGGAGRDFNIGVVVSTGSRIQNTTGSISITGTGGTGVAARQNNDGVDFFNAGSRVSTTTGAINITGQGGGGGGSGIANLGIFLDEGTEVSRTGAGAGSGITLSGTGGTGSQFNAGFVTFGTITTVDGPISITGTGGPGVGVDSVECTGSCSYGVVIGTPAHVTSSGLAAITVSGTGGQGPGTNLGVLVDGATVESVTGAIQITGTGGGTGTSNHGIALQEGAQVIATGSAPITLTGLGAGSDAGIFADSTSGGNVIGGVGATGPITLRAGTQSGSGDSIQLSALTIQGSGNLFLEPIAVADSVGLSGGAGTFNLDATELGFIQDGFSHLFIGRTDGTGTATVGAVGFTFKDPVTIQSAAAGGAGSVIVNGPVVTTGTDSVTLLAGKNIVVDHTSSNLGAVTTDSGNILVKANDSGTSVSALKGVSILGTGANVTSGTGTIDIQGTGGADNSFTYGVVMAQGRVSSGGDISISGHGGGGNPLNIAPLGVLITNASQVEGTGSAKVTIVGVGGSGTATSATNGEVGVFIHGQNGTFIRTSNGDLTITGTGNGTGIGGQGVILRAGALVESINSGNVIVNGTGSLTGSANNNGIQMIEAGTTVRSNTGNITMTGTAHGALNSTNNIGAAIASGSLVQKTGSGGTVTVTGLGGDGGGGVNNFGVALLSAPTQILANNGTITITGTGGTGGAAGVTAQGGFIVGAPGIPCGSCAPSGNLSAGGSGTITINSTP